MKKLIVIQILIVLTFTNCGQDKSLQEEIAITTDSIDAESTIDITEVLDTNNIDINYEKANELIKSTENVHNKVKEIKDIKAENKVLKKELVETKAELEQVKAVLADTTLEPTKKKKKNFIQKVISTIKKDTAQ